MGHLPVCKWLCMAMGVLKRRASMVNQGWDNEATDTLFTRMVEETLMRVQQNDPTYGDWCADGEKVNLWVDTSSLVIGVLLEEDRNILEDVY